MKTEGPGGPIKGRATATKTSQGWDVKLEPDFLEELKDMSESQRKEVYMLIEGLKNGTIDPMTMGKRMCGYCGSEMKNEVPIGTNICEKCSNELT